MALDKLLTFTDYYNQLKTLDDLRKKWLSFMERLKAVQDNLPEGKYLNSPHNISDSMIQIMSNSLDTVLPSGTNVVKKIYKDLGVIKYNGTLYVGFPNSDLNNYLSGKTSTELNIRRVILLQGNNGCIGCCVRFINEFTPPQFSSGNYDILKCGGDSTSWIYNYRWFEMEALGNLATDGMVDLVSTNNIGISASDPNAIFSPRQQIDVVSSIHSCYGSIIPKEVNFNQTRFCMNNNISSSSFAVKTKPNKISNGTIIFTASKIGSSFIITVKPRLIEWQWAYPLLVFLGKFVLLEAVESGCPGDCTQYPEMEQGGGTCDGGPESHCTAVDSKTCSQQYDSARQGNAYYNVKFELKDESCGASPYREDVTDENGNIIYHCGNCPKGATGGRQLCKSAPLTFCQSGDSPSSCTYSAISAGNGCNTINTYPPAQELIVNNCSIDNQCVDRETMRPSSTLGHTEVTAYGVGSRETLNKLQAFYNLWVFGTIINNMCVHTSINIIKSFIDFAKNINVPSQTIRDTPFRDSFMTCIDDGITKYGLSLDYDSWGVVYNTCDCVENSAATEANCVNIAEIDSCGLMQVHIGDTTTWTFFP